MKADPTAPEESLERLVQTVRQSAKYRHVSLDLVRRIGARELAARRTAKEAVKATKNKLHQVGGAYQEGKLDYAGALALLKDAFAAGDQPTIQQTCRQIMQSHASTRERLDDLDDFYAQIMAELPPIRSLIDVACGLNPLARSWMPLPAGVEYHACDIYGDMIAFLQQYMDLAGIPGRSEVRDVIADPPHRSVDLALILKTLPCLEQVDKTAAAQLLDAIDAAYLLVSYPVRSLGGRSKGMAENYERQFHALIDGRGWHVQRFEFASELAFLVETGKPISG